MRIKYSEWKHQLMLGNANPDNNAGLEAMRKDMIERRVVSEINDLDTRAVLQVEIQKGAQ